MIALPKTPAEAIVEGYLVTGDGLTVPQIASALGWSEGRVRRSIDVSHGAPLGCVAAHEHRDGATKVVKVWVYYPSLLTLRDMVNNYRGIASGRPVARDPSKPVSIKPRGAPSASPYDPEGIKRENDKRRREGLK